MPDSKLLTENVMTHEHSNKYTCPMHPEVIKDAPGKCPKCGMDLIPVKESKTKMTHIGHEGHQPAPKGKKHSDEMPGHAQHGGGGHAHHAGMIDDFKKRFYVALALTIPIMALSPMIQHWLNVDWTFPESNYILLSLSSVVFFYGGWPFLTGFINEIKSKSLGMMTLVAVAITVAYVYSVAFFQAEDGIRDDLVTGVQTCALPIYRRQARIVPTDVDVDIDETKAAA